jgi:hypothetical protein
VGVFSKGAREQGSKWQPQWRANGWARLLFENGCGLKGLTYTVYLLDKMGLFSYQPEEQLPGRTHLHHSFLPVFFFFLPSLPWTTLQDTTLTHISPASLGPITASDTMGDDARMENEVTVWCSDWSVKAGGGVSGPCQWVCGWPVSHCLSGIQGREGCSGASLIQRGW